MTNKLPDYYDEPKFDYHRYWDKRQYEDGAERVALNKLLVHIKNKNLIGDLGCGFGRLATLYGPLFKKCILVDPSQQMLDQAKNHCQKISNIEFKQGSLESLPLPDDFLDTALIVRTLHHLPKLEKAFQEVARVIKPHGYLILEYPNKRHFKNILKKIIRGHLKLDINPINIATNIQVPFYNFHPEHIHKLLIENKFIIKKKLSVSNFRCPIIKKVLPTNLLLGLEKISQKTFPSLNLGPSVFILAQKIP